MDALFGRAAGLRRVELVEPKHVIGKSTAESIQSGVIYGFSAQVDGLVDRFVAELGECDGHRDRRPGRADHPALAYGAALRAVAHPLRSADHLRTEPLMEPTNRATSASSRQGRRDPRPRRRSVSGPLRPHAHAAARCASTGTTRSRPARRPTTSCASRAGCCCKRAQGRLVFATLRDGTGELQLFVSQGELGDDAFARFGDEIDRGDWVGVEGKVMKTKLGELSVNVSSFQLLVEGAAPAAREVARPLRHRHALPPALRRPHRERRRAPRVRRSGSRRSPRCAGSSPSAASSRSRRRCCTRSRAARPRAVRDAPQRARRRPLPAHRARAVPEAADRRRLRQGVRDRARVPQRRARRPGTIPSSRCSSSTRRSPTTTT